MKKFKSFASQGASVMLGRNRGLVTFFNGFTGRDLYAVHCHAHKIHLAIRHAFDSQSYMFHFESEVDSIYSFYNSHGHKRKGHMIQTAEEEGIRLFELNKIFAVS